MTRGHAIDMWAGSGCVSYPAEDRGEEKRRAKKEAEVVDEMDVNVIYL